MNKTLDRNEGEVLKKDIEKNPSLYISAETEMKQVSGTPKD